jgi:hypothetical protein
MKNGSGVQPSGSRPTSFAARLSQAIVVASLITGIVLRIVALDAAPPGLHHDEACNGYDAYSILHTGRDHHGNFMPIAVQAFGDYRPPIFDYSLVPLIGAFGLKPAVVRLGAALWGVVDLAATISLAGLMLGWPGAAAAALLGALSPWHLSFSRFGQEAITGSATVTLAMLCFMGWVSRRKTNYLMMSAIFFGLSFYSYSVVKLFTPLMIGLMATLYWRELRQSWRKALIALAVIGLLVAPEAILTLRHHVRMQARYNVMSLFAYMNSCPNCLPAAAAQSSDSMLARVENFSANWSGYFTPSYLFLAGDRGDHWALLHPQGFGQLLPEQAPLIAMGLLGLLSTRRRRMVLMLLGWLVIAAIPAAMTVPSGAWQPEPGVSPPTPLVFMDISIPNVPVTPALLMAHPESRRDTLAMTPWTVLSAVGFVVLLEVVMSSSALAAVFVVVVVLVAGTVFHGGRFVRAYFHDYPIVAAPYFQYGMEQVVAETRKADGDHQPVVITNRMEMPYIYVLFFDKYPPALFQHEQVVYQPGAGPLYAGVAHFDNFWFGNPLLAFLRMPRGVFVFPESESLEDLPSTSIKYPDGSVAYSVIVK